MKYFLLVIFSLSSIVLHAQDLKKLNICKGRWRAELKLSEKEALPFTMTVDKIKGHYTFIIHNGKEEILLDSIYIAGDSVHVRFPYFNSKLIFAVNNKKNISGYWHNYSKGSNYKIPFKSYKSKEGRFPIGKNAEKNNFSGKWQVTFEPNTNSEYPAIGVFEQEKSSLSGTFLTETGDYRYLEGVAINDILYLSCFDGSHAFLFKAKYINDSLHGVFMSGNHWKSSWIAVRNETFELADPEELTYLKENEELEFELPDLSGEMFTYPNDDYLNKVVIIQIMGSWCPNCLDETIYFKDLYDKYHDRGLEIISIGYEMGDSFEDYVANVERLKSKLSLDYTFLIGGNASKSTAEEDFYMLNNIISFPTSIFIGRDGEVKRVHTGFSGPGTGVYYDQYVKQTNAFIESLLAN